MHLTSLRIENFRSLKNFEVKRLGHVNLIVGKNNSGKSSVLEALRIYAAGATPSTMQEIAESHDEKFQLSESDDVKDMIELPYENFFTGRKFPSVDDNPIYIGSSDKSHFLLLRHELGKMISIVKLIDNEDRLVRQYQRVSKPDVINGTEDYEIHSINVERHDGQFKRIIIDPESTGRTSFASRGWNNIVPSSYLPTQFISIDEIASIWDTIQFTEHGDFIRQGLKLISSDIENLAFVSNEIEPPYSRYRKQMTSQRQAKLKLAGVSKAVSLNSMGDGVLRVLQLLLKAFPARNGILLIDEFENGLHYSVQERIWESLFELAKILNIQVFATTHSWDCIESFSKVATRREDSEGVLFRVGRSARKSDSDSVIATEFNEEQLKNITQSDVEVR